MNIDGYEEPVPWVYGEPIEIDLENVPAEWFIQPHELAFFDWNRWDDLPPPPKPAAKQDKTTTTHQP